MSSLRTVKHEAAPRHATPFPRPTLSRRIQLSRVWTFAWNASLVFAAIVVLFSAVLGILAITSWASDHRAGSAIGRAF
jgi:hypothetical protein